MKHKRKIHHRIIKPCLILFFLIAISPIAFSQNIKKVSLIYGELIETDSANTEAYKENIYSNNQKYLYDIFHIKILSPKGDTILLAIVYNLKREIDSIANFCGLEIGKIYSFVVSEFFPCNSDFPLIYNCDYTTKRLRKSDKKIKFKSYKKINRVIEFGEIDLPLWNKLKNLNSY